VSYGPVILFQFNETPGGPELDGFLGETVDLIQAVNEQIFAFVENVWKNRDFEQTGYN
jgi:hypothetical protein